MSSVAEGLTIYHISHSFLFESFYPFNSCDTAFFSSFFLFFFFLFFSFFFQNWGDYTDMSQGVLLYIMYASDVLLICWFGAQLTQHVRQSRLFKLMLTLLTHYFHNVYGASSQLRNYGSIKKLRIFLSYNLSFIKFSLA